MGVAIAEPFDQYVDINTTEGLQLTSNWGTDHNDLNFASFIAGFNGSGKALLIPLSGSGGDHVTFWREIPLTTQVSFALAVKFGLDGDVGHEFLRFNDSANAHQCGLFLDGLGRLKLTGEANAVVATASGNVLQHDVVYRITGKLDIAAGTATVNVNGIEVINATGLDLQDSSLTQIGFIQIYGFTNPGVSVTWDSIYVLESEYIDLPELELSLYGPTADTADDDWVPSTGVDNFAMLDELPISASDYVTSDTVGAKDILTYADENRVAEEIVSVSLMFAGSKDEVGTRTAKQILKAGGLEYPGADHNWSTTPTIKFDHWRENPNTTNPWAEGEVDGLQAGYELVL